MIKGETKFFLFVALTAVIGWFCAYRFSVSASALPAPRKIEANINLPQIKTNVESKSNITQISNIEAALGGVKRDVKNYTLVEFSDYQCPSCRFYSKEINKEVSKYKGKVKLIIRNMPFALHPKAMPAALAAEAAREQSKFEPMHHALFAAHDINQKTIDSIAKSLNLDMAKFHRALETTAKDRVQADIRDFSRLGLNSTPSFVLCTPEGEMWSLSSLDQLAEKIKH